VETYDSSGENGFFLSIVAQLYLDVLLNFLHCLEGTELLNHFLERTKLLIGANFRHHHSTILCFA